MTNERMQQENITRLTDERFPWVERRKKTVRLAQIYDRAGYQEYAERAGACATWLQFYEMESGEKSLMGANFCDLRLCPMCSARRAKRAAYKLSQVMNAVQAERCCRYLFLTLTVRNCTGEELGKTLDLLTESWFRLVRNRRFERAVGGWFRAIEITRNRRDGTYHPHIHAILAVPQGYFDQDSPLYIPQAEFVERWRKAARLDYDPSVRIQVTKAKAGAADRSAAATLEAAKYATKDTDYIDQRLSLDKAARIVADYTRALYRRRMTAFGGWMKEAARRYDADLEHGDLVHVDEHRIREDIADMICTYGWNLGAGDYILAEKHINPLKAAQA